MSACNYCNLADNLTNHVVIEVVNLDPRERTFRSHSRLYDHKDTAGGHWL
jgi:hypothetical protein